MNESTLKKTKNYFRCVGACYEKSLTRENRPIEIKDAEGNSKGTVNGERIFGKVSVRCDDGIHEFRAYFQSHNPRPDKNGNHENNQWKMAESMMDWNPEIGGTDSPATLVNIEGILEVNDYVGQDNTVKTAVQRTIRKASTKVSADEAKLCSWSGVGFIKSIRSEVFNEEETGRLIVEVLGVNGKSEVFPIKAFVEKDMADDFENAFSEKQTIPMDMDIVVRHVGKKSVKKTFGRNSSVSVNEGFDVTEYIIVGADEPIEEPDEDDEGNIIDNGWLNPEAIKKALNERKKKLEELLANGAVTTRKSTSSVSSNNTFKKTVAKAVEAFDDEEDPF